MDQYFLRDWRIFVAAALHWLAGGDPYGPFTSSFGTYYHPGAYGYPPPSLLLITPLALLPWQLTGVLFVLVSALCFERWVRLTSRRSGLPWLLLWLPLVQGLVIGQTTLIVLVALVFAERDYNQGRDWRSGLLLALAVLKPQVAILAGSWLLLRAVRERRYLMLQVFFGVTIALWSAILLIAGPRILPQWVGGLIAYDDLLPDRLLLFPPFGPLLGLMAMSMWWRRGRGDTFGLLMLLNTLFYPLSVIYMTSVVAFIVIRWRRDWPWYPLALSWLIPVLFPLTVRTPDTIAALTQAIVATGMLAGLLPQIPLPRPPFWRVGQGEQSPP